MKIEFQNPADITTSPATVQNISELNIGQMVDNPKRKIVAVNTRELGRIVLWERDAYDTIGQWTDTDVINRLKELYPY